jgi:hypothetical protein
MRVLSYCEKRIITRVTKLAEIRGHTEVRLGEKKLYASKRRASVVLIKSMAEVRTSDPFLFFGLESRPRRQKVPRWRHLG